MRQRLTSLSPLAVPPASASLTYALKVTVAALRRTVLLGVACAAACTRGEPTAPQLTPASITIAPTSVTLRSLGDTLRLSPTVRDARGELVVDASIQWVSADTMVVKVTAAGVITAVGNGATHVAARTGRAIGQVRVIVAQVPHTLGVAGSPDRSVSVSDVTLLSAFANDSSGNPIPDPPVAWSSSDPSVLRISAQGEATAVRSGQATVTATLDRFGAEGHLSAEVRFEIAVTKIESIPSALQTPAAGAIWTIPVVIIRMLPTVDGTTLDLTGAGISGPLSRVKARIQAFEERIKFMLEEGSRFRGYSDAAAPYSLGYRVVRILTVYEPFARGREVPWNPGHYFPDYHRILETAGAEEWVNGHGVKEFWVWGYHNDEFEQPESNMSSPISGDISNSSRFSDDLPVFNHTYTVYGYNYGRTQAEAVHNHGHQLEAILSHVDYGLFWNEFAGLNATNDGWLTGRSGWTHMPPNTTTHYDYLNNTLVESDIADWRPGGGRRTPVSRSTWASVPYGWPVSRAPDESQIFQRDESQWYIYWMQSMPGRDNGIPHGTGELTNWWRFTGDWDGAIAEGYGLTTLARRISVRNDYHGAVTISPGGLLEPGQTATLNSSAPLTVAVYDCGEPGGCKLDPYVLIPGRNYAVVSDPAGPVHNLTIVELPAGRAWPPVSHARTRP